MTKHNHTCCSCVTDLAKALRPFLNNAVLMESLRRFQQVRACEECGDEFVAKDSRQVFCTSRCSSRARQRRFAEKRAAEAAA